MIIMRAKSLLRRKTVKMPDHDTPEYLKNALKFGIRPGLERITRLCEFLDHPERSFRVIHIAGTNGKGSTSAFIASIMAASGLRTGLFTSPFLERFSERIRILNGRDDLIRYSTDDRTGEIPDGALSELTAVVKKAADQMVSEGMEHPTEFELVTAICFLYFRDENIDIAVMETGLGGRYDSTNVFDDPVASVITSIGMDHMDILGSTIGQIAGEKAGIFKKGCPAFCTDPDHMILTPSEAEEVREVLVREAEKAGVSGLEFIVPNTDTVTYGDDLRMSFDAGLGEKVTTTLLGDHQCGNCSLAVKAALSASRIWPQITDETIREGISLTRWKCRAEVLRTDPLVIMDGCHNLQGALSFSSLYGRLIEKDPSLARVRLVIGVMRDKDMEGIIRTFRDNGIIPEEVWPVKVNNPRSATSGELYNIIKEVYNVSVGRGDTDVPEEAVRRALDRSLGDKLPLIVTGSLYLLGQVRGVLKGII